MPQYKKKILLHLVKHRFTFSNFTLLLSTIYTAIYIEIIKTRLQWPLQSSSWKDFNWVNL